MSPKTPQSHRRWLPPLLVIFIGTLAYSNTLHGPFIFDDLDGIASNPQIRSLIPNRYPPARPTTLSGRPMLVFSFAADYAIAGINVEIYHLTNLSIHLLLALLLYAIVRRTLLSAQLPAQSTVGSPICLAAIVVALWVTHPLTTSAVTYTVQRAESLASLFLLASIYCLIRSAAGSKSWGAAAVAMCGLGMASKEIVAAAPILAILYDRTFLAGSFEEAFRRRWKIYLGMAVMWGFTISSFLIDRHEGTVGFSLSVSPMAYARTELNVIAHYFYLAFCPANLALDYYDWPIAWHWSDISWQGWLVAGMLVGVVLALRYKPWLGFLGAWFFLILAPSSSFLPVLHEAAADQRMYLPLAGIVVVIIVGGAVILRRWPRLRRMAGIAACVIIIMQARMTWDRNEQYQTARTIWTDTVAKRPNNARARGNLAATWVQTSLEYPDGSPPAMSAARQAKEQFQLARSCDPNFDLNVFAQAIALDRSGDPSAAENFYTQSIAKHPELRGDLLVDRGNLRARRQDWADAKADFLAAIRLNPANVEPHYSLGILDQELRDWHEAGSEFAAVMAISPGYRDAPARLEQVRKILSSDRK